MVQIVGASGVGKSAILKSLALRQRSEGTIIVLSPGASQAAAGRGWLRLSGGRLAETSCSTSWGAAAGRRFHRQHRSNRRRGRLAYVARPAAERHGLPGWRAVFTARSDDQEWRANLPDEMRSSSFGIIRVNPLSDAEAEVLCLGNPALSALLSNTHPARVMARNLFYLSRLANLPPPSDEAAPVLASELDLAGMWWRFGGGRSGKGSLAASSCCGISANS